jgi:hypothetical protein
VKYNTLFIFLIAMAAVLLFAKPAYAQGTENAPEIIATNQVFVGETMSVTVKTDYPFWNLYFVSSGGIIEYPEGCTMNVVGGVTCEKLDAEPEEYHFVLEEAPSYAFELALFARTTFGNQINDSSFNVRIKPNPAQDDRFKVRPGEVSEIMAYTSNDDLDSGYNGTGVEPASLPFSYTTMQMGAIQFSYPITGSYVLTYWIGTPYGITHANIYLEVTPDAPASRFPDPQDDYIVIYEGEDTVLDILSNDKYPTEEEDIFLYTYRGALPFPLQTPSPYVYKVISPTIGTYTMTYELGIYGIGAAKANVYLTVIPKEPTDLPSAPQPIMPQNSMWLPVVESANDDRFFN